MDDVLGHAKVEHALKAAVVICRGEGLNLFAFVGPLFLRRPQLVDHHVDNKLLRVHGAHLNAAEFHGHQFYEPLDGGVLVHAGSPIFIVSDPVIKQLSVACQDFIKRP